MAFGAEKQAKWPIGFLGLFHLQKSDVGKKLAHLLCYWLSCAGTTFGLISPNLKGGFSTEVIRKTKEAALCVPCHPGADRSTALCRGIHIPVSPSLQYLGICRRYTGRRFLSSLTGCFLFILPTGTYHLPLQYVWDFFMPSNCHPAFIRGDAYGNRRKRNLG